MHKSFTLLLMLLGAGATLGDNGDDLALQAAVSQLRESIGEWDVLTEFLDEDGSVAQSANGSYAFAWVIEDRVVSGVSRIPDLDRTSAILFYVNEGEQKIEMVSVGGDGKLWIMNGPLNSETRYSQEYEAADGNTAQLRFTRYNVSPGRFESRMEYTTDGGMTWLPGNHQVFERREPTGL